MLISLLLHLYLFSLHVLGWNEGSNLLYKPPFSTQYSALGSLKILRPSFLSVIQEKNKHTSEQLLTA